MPAVSFGMQKIADKQIPFSALQTMVVQYGRLQRSASTRANYQADWNMLRRWCETSGEAFPPADRAFAPYFAYLLACGHKAVSVARRIPSFRFQYRALGLRAPDLTEAAEVLAGARRQLRERPKKMAALTAEQLGAVCRALGGRSIDVRDRALLVLGFASGMRASELAALQLSDVTFVDEGLEIVIQKSKTDQEGRGRRFGVWRGECAPCPVETLHDWLELRGLEAGPLFYACTRSRVRAGRRISREIVHRAVRRAAGLIGLEALGYGSHSLRASFVTAAAARGADALAIMQVTGHRNVATVAGYVRAETFACRLARAL